MDDERFAIEHLNLDDLDVQELEARLELSVASPSAAPGSCSGDAGCNVYCGDCKNCYNGCVTECTPAIES